MKKITFRYLSGTTKIGRFIKWFSWSRASHVDYKVNDTTAFSAVGGKGVLFYDINAKKSLRTIEESFWVTDEQFHRFESFLFAQEGKGYDFHGIFAFVFRWDMQHRSKWFCSELLIAGLEYAGIIELTEHSSRWKPSDMLKAMSFIGVQKNPT